MNLTYTNTSTICAISSPQGSGGVALIRISGKQAFTICNRCLKGSSINNMSSHSLKLATFIDPESNATIDQVIASIYKNPASYTGEDVVELSTHGSVFIQEKVIQILIKQGATLAQKGEFTFRAFLNKKLDLTQAEAVADIISASSQKALDIALNQIKGGVSQAINNFKDELIKFAALIELELDFSQEDVEFASRSEMTLLVSNLKENILKLVDSFESGNAIKHGVPVALVGAPNAGKSTLLNALLKEDKAIVSNIAGTTRDAIEDTITINDTLFRFIDTAGIRDSENAIEILGIKKTYAVIKQSHIVLLLIDLSHSTLETLNTQISQIQLHLNDKQTLILGLNKSDLCTLPPEWKTELDKYSTNYVVCSAKTQSDIELLKNTLYTLAFPKQHNTSVLLTNIRHFQALQNTLKVLYTVEENISNRAYTELIASDIKQMVIHLSEITGSISHEDILDSIFSNFCIGK